MGLIAKLLVGRTVADVTGKEVKKAGKKVKKSVKRAKRTVLIAVLSFCAGAACMGWFVYTHRNTVAAAVKAMPAKGGKHRCWRGKLPHR